MDSILIRGLRVDTHVGVTEEERSTPQTVVADIAIATDLSAAGRSDAIGDTVDYEEASRVAAQAIGAAPASLLEHLAERVARGILALKGVNAVTVEIAKDPPPVGENVQNIAVRIERQRS